MDLENIIRELKFPSVIEQTIQSKIYEDETRSLAKTAYTGENFEFELTKQSPVIRLVVVTYLLRQKYEEYKTKGVSDSIIFDTFRDVTLRAELYYKKSGEVGILKDDVIWFRHIMDVSIFKIGVLQYQLFKMIYYEPNMEFPRHQKRLLPAQSPVINCHIQYGADLSSEAVEASINAAKNFFATVFPEIKFKALLCYSWLLYPPMVNRLPKESNIRQFADRFIIIGTCGESEQAMYNLQSDRETTMTRMVKENKELFGFACGIIGL